MSVEFWLTPSADYPYENPIRGQDITSATRYWTLTQDMPEQRSTVVLGLRRSLVPNIVLGDIVEVINWPVWSDHAFSGIVTGIGTVKKGMVEVTVSGRDSLLANMRMDPFTGQVRDRDILHKLGLFMGFPSSSDPYYVDYIHVDRNYTWDSYHMTDRTGLDCLSDLNGTQIDVGDPLTYAYVSMTWGGTKVAGKPATHVVGKVHRRQDNHVSLPQLLQWVYTPTGGDIIGEPEYSEDINAIVNSVTVVGDKVSATVEEAASIARYGRRPRTYHAPWIVSQADAKVKAARLVSRLSVLDTRVTVSRPRSSAHPWPPEYMYWAEFGDQINGRYIYGRIIRVEFDSRKPTIRYTIGSPTVPSSMSGSLFALSNELSGVKSGLDQSLKTTDTPTFAGASVGDLEVGGVRVINSARDLINVRDIILSGGIWFGKLNDQIILKDSAGNNHTLWKANVGANQSFEVYDLALGARFRVERNGNAVFAGELYPQGYRSADGSQGATFGAQIKLGDGSNAILNVKNGIIVGITQQ